MKTNKHLVLTVLRVLQYIVLLIFDSWTQTRWQHLMILETVSPKFSSLGSVQMFSLDCYSTISRFINNKSWQLVKVAFLQPNQSEGAVEYILPFKNRELNYRGQTATQSGRNRGGVKYGWAGWNRSRRLGLSRELHRTSPQGHNQSSSNLALAPYHTTGSHDPQTFTVRSTGERRDRPRLPASVF